MRARLAVVLALAGCSLAGADRSRLTDLDDCADRRDTAYMAMRELADELVREQGLELSDALAGLEAASKIRTVRGVSLSHTDSDFLKRNGFFGLYGGATLSPERFAALRTCMQQRHGYTIRTIEVRTP